MSELINSQIIQYLSNHDALTLGDLGMFLVKSQPAFIDYKKQQAVPPSRIIVFNAEISSNNDRLEQILVQALGLSLQEAEKLVNDYVEKLKKSLYSSGQVQINGLGVFYLSSDIVKFEQDKKVNINAESFGLPKVNFEKLNHQKSISKLRPAMLKDESIDELSVKIKPKKKNILLLVSIPLLLVVAASGFLWENRKNETYASFNPFAILSVKSEPVKHKDSSSFNYDDPMGRNTNAVEIEKNEKVEIEVENNPVEKENIGEVASATVPENSTVDQEKLAKTTKVSSIAEIISSKTERYYIICASFETLIKAEEFAGQLEEKGLDNFKIIEPNSKVNRYRVTLNDFENEKEAQKEAKKLRPQFGEDIWVYKY
ncbi:MAG: SPOR domain-containing protein [Cytophagales bacterium]